MVDNCRVPTPLPRRGLLIVVTAVTLALGIAGCGHAKPPRLLRNQPNASAAPPDPRASLAALAAALLDKRYVAVYTLRADGQADRSVLVSMAADGSWRVDVPGGALSGGANVSIVSNGSGVYQCLLSGPATNAAPTTSPSAPDPSASPGSPEPAPLYPAPACVRAAAAGKPVPKRADPVIEHLFTDWLSVMIDRNSPILVFQASPLPDSSGRCYSVEPSSASLAPAMNAGIFCFAVDGTLTAAALAGARLALAGAPAPAPPTNPLPGPLVTGSVAPTKTPGPAASG